MFFFSDPADFEFDSPREFIFTPDNFNETYCFSVVIVDDEVLEDTEMFTLFLTGGTDVHVKDGKHTIKIIDNDSEFSIISSEMFCSMF